MTNRPSGFVPRAGRGVVALGGIFAVAIGLATTGCGPGTASQDGSTGGANPTGLRIVCTTGQVGDMIRRLGGEHVSVETLMGPGVDPHLYKPTPADSRRLQQADVVFYSGLHLEGRLAGFLEKLAAEKPVFAVTEGLRTAHAAKLRKTPGSTETYDPHVWFDVGLWKECVKYAAGCLAERDPARAKAYQANGREYVAELEALNHRCRDEMARIPKQRRVLVTAHDAFGYFGQAYDVEVHGLQGISTVDEADLGAVNGLVDLLVSRKIKAVFVESSVSEKNIRALVEGCHARGHEVRVGGQLYSDALGPAGTPEESYVGVVKYNVKTIVDALL